MQPRLPKDPRNNVHKFVGANLQFDPKENRRIWEVRWDLEIFLFGFVYYISVFAWAIQNNKEIDFGIRIILLSIRQKSSL